MNVLFICTQNEWRSPTAEEIFKKTPGWKVKSAGTSKSAKHSLNSTDVSWADVIFVMEKRHLEILNERFPSLVKDKKLINLDIPDEYEYMDPDLVTLLEEAVHDHMNELSGT